MYDLNSLGIILCDERTQTFFAENAFWKPPIGVLQLFAVEHLGLNLGGLHSGGFMGYGRMDHTQGSRTPPPTIKRKTFTFSPPTRTSRTLAGLVYVFSYIISGDK